MGFLSIRAIFFPKAEGSLTDHGPCNDTSGCINKKLDLFPVFDGYQIPDLANIREGC